jgi:hypothetical protein
MRSTTWFIAFARSCGGKLGAISSLPVFTSFDVVLVSHFVLSSPFSIRGIWIASLTNLRLVLDDLKTFFVILGLHFLEFDSLLVVFVPDIGL